MTQTIDHIPEPRGDWINQRELADLIGVSQRTASIWAKQGRLKRYEHGSAAGGQRKYSRRLLLLEIQQS